MQYLYKEKLNLLELFQIPAESKTVLLAEPEEYLLALYSGYLTNNNFSVKPCSQIRQLDGIIKKHSPDLLLFSVHFYEDISQGLDFLNSLSRDYPTLPVVTLGHNVGNDILKDLMSTGIVSHIERKLTRPKDIVVVAKTILNS